MKSPAKTNLPSRNATRRQIPVRKLAQLAGSAAIALFAAGGGATHAATSYYVATTGSDANPGTQTAPWRTINHAAQLATAGQTVFVRGGTYNEYVALANSGNATAGYITFQNFPGESPIVDGTGVNCCGSSIRGLFNIASKSYIILSGFEIRNYKSTSALEEPAGILVVGSGSNIQILNNSVHDIQTSAEASNGNAHGIGVYGQAATPYSNIAISGNQIYNLRTGWSESMTVEGNVTNFTISNNVIHDNDNIGIDLAGFWGTGPTGHDQALLGTVSGNTIYNITSASNPAYAGGLGANGIYCDGCSQVTIERNLVHHCDIGIEAASERKGRVASLVTIRDNLVYDANQVDISIGGYASTVGGSDSITIVNNTLYQSAGSPGNGFQIQYKAANSVFKNNVVYLANAGQFLYYFTSSTTAPVAMDYNVYFDSATSPTWVWKNKTYTSLARFTAGSGQDTHSRYANPFFTNLPGLDFHLTATSPAVGAGINLGTAVVGPTDFAGSTRVVGVIDAGAYER